MKKASIGDRIGVFIILVLVHLFFIRYTRIINYKEIFTLIFTGKSKKYINQERQQ